MSGIHIFRRDLRLSDNVALHDLSKKVKKIIPIFIFDPFQIDHTSENAHYRSDPAVKIMIESLDDLNKELGNKLQYFYGQPDHVLEKIIKIVKPTHISYNADFSEYSLKRDKHMDEVIKKHDIQLIKNMDDNCLNKMELYLNKKNIYKVFGAFYKNGIKQKIREEVSKPSNFTTDSKLHEITFKKDIHHFYNKSLTNLVHGGRKEALKILNNMDKFKNYEAKRDNLTYNTTFLSTYLKFGCVSIVEVYNHMKKHKLTALIRQLYWRQFHFILSRFNHVGYSFTDEFFPHVKWRNNVSEAKALWSGNTGFPIIDAGVRQLIQTGYMHNRLRLYVSNFAIKVLHQNPFSPVWGGQVQFSKMLIDCCYANNFGNWNNSLGPYDAPGYRFGKGGTMSGRLYDPTNYKKWDIHLEFIRKYIPELKDVPDRDVANWHKYYEKYKNVYIKPIVDFQEKKQEWYLLTKK